MSLRPKSTITATTVTAATTNNISITTLTGWSPTITEGLSDSPSAPLTSAAQAPDWNCCMSVEIKLPSLGEGVETADVAEVLVQAGDVIEAGQVLMELETDKAVVPVPSDHAGVVESINVSQGDTISIGQVIARIAGATPGEPEAPQSDDAKDTAEQKPSDNGAGKPAAASKSADAPSAPPKTQAAAPQAQEGPPKAEQASSRLTVLLPSLGEGVASADVAEVRVAVGDRIEQGQPILEVETEKAVSEVPSEAAGIVREVLVTQGQTLAVGDALIVLETSAPAKSESPPAQKTSAEPAEPKEPAPPPKKDDPKPVAKQVARPPEKGAGETIVIDTRRNDNLPPVPAAPSTRRLARQLGVELRQVNGTGPGGRITRDDVQGYVKVQLTAIARAEPAGGAMTSRVGGLVPPPLPDFTRFGPVDREKLNKIGRTAAENLTLSWHVIPHVTHHDKADVTEMEEARKRFTTGVGKDVPKVTMTAIVIKALAKCLQGFPKFNSSLDPETFEIVYKRYINIGCAVDTPSGLVVPVIRDCGRKSIVDIAGELAQLADQARERKLSIESMQGATCTVTNLGGIGGLAFTPIINYPEVCILGMSRTQKELQLIDGHVKERLLLTLSLSYDHRVINGADAARFMAAMCGMLSDPFQLLSMI
jgi:pyruvate dehydrogenase E2 component (dihydrolipoamide acetyltransferase)